MSARFPALVASMGMTLKLPVVTLDRYVALLEEDQALRHAEYDRPDPRRRRLKVSCNACEKPWCCYQRVEVEPVEALVIWRWAREHAAQALRLAIQRGEKLRARPPEGDEAFFRRKEPCPFLVRGKCAIFPVRPYRCRSHYMAGPPIKCRDELSPRDSYEMSPDRSLWREAKRIAEEVEIEVSERELSSALAEVGALARKV